MSRELIKIVDELSREKGLNRSQLSEVLKESIIAAVSKKYGKQISPKIEMDLEKGDLTINIPKKVVRVVENKWSEISKDDALKINDKVRIGSEVEVPITIESLGRQAATIAKQKLLEELRNTEKQVILDKYQNRVGEIITGVVVKSDKNGLLVNVGKAEAMLYKREMIPGDVYNRGDYVRALLSEIRIVRGWPQLILSRTHPDFLKKLFEVEIPEVFEGIIEVKAVAREPGDRAKVAVYTTNANIDPVGACIGLKGMRINGISNELRGEKIDVIEWSPDVVKFVCVAISPAEVILTNIFEDEETIEVIVPDDQLSLAIGKKGQNVRLAARITGWKLDVLKESEYNEIRKERMSEQEQEWKEFYELYNLENLQYLTEEMISKLFQSGINDVEKLSTASIEEIKEVLQVNEEEAIDIINKAIDYLTSKLEGMEE
ncbi:MAG: transcription termination factor NusA [Deferribacterota bacterium]|nr:transcription termination factor NusA [Deferribacterota bacterium]